MLKIYYLKWTKIKNKKNFSRYDNFFYKPLKVEINVYPSVFLRKIPLTGKHLSFIRNPLGGFLPSLCRTNACDCRTLSLFSARKKRAQALFTHYRLNNCPIAKPIKTGRAHIRNLLCCLF